MTSRIRRRLCVLACLALAIALCTAPAAADDDGIGLNATVGDTTVAVEASGDDGGTVGPDATVDTDMDDGDASAETNGSADGERTDDDSTVSLSASGDLDAEASAGDVTVEADADANDSGATVDAGASAGNVSVAANGSVSGDAVDVAAEADVDGPATVSASVSTNGSTAVGETVDTTEGTGATSASAPEPTPPSSEPTASTTPATPMESSSDDGPTGGPDPPDGTNAGIGVLAVAGGAAAARRGASAVANGTAPAGIVDTLAAALDWVRAKCPRLVVPFGYSRHDDSDPLVHEVRADLYERVQTAPGVHLSGLEREVDVSLSSVRHHVRILEGESLIESHRIRGKRRYFPAGEVDPELVAALDEPATASVLHTVATREPASVSALADRLGRDPSTISHHLSRLADDGLVERERDGQAVKTRLSPRTRELLAAEDDVGLAASAD